MRNQQDLIDQSRYNNNASKIILLIKYSDSRTIKQNSLKMNEEEEEEKLKSLRKN